MPRIATKLTVAGIKAKRDGIHADGGGLYLRVAGNSRAWVFRYVFGGRRHKMGLGPFPDVSLDDARELAADYRKALRRDRIDPLASRRAEKADRPIERARQDTFAQVAATYIAKNESGWKNPKHRAQWSATLETYAFPVFGEVSVAKIDTGMVLAAVEPIWNTKSETASRLRGRIETVLDYAKTRELRAGENPARWKGHLENLLPRPSKVRRVQHLAALPYVEIPALIASLRAQDSVSARALEFAILTAARTGEALGAVWSEIEMDKALWVVPAERIKAGREHRVPLSASAMGVLERMRAAGDDEGGLVFPGQRAGKPLSDMSLLMLLRRMGRDDLTVHGFRSTFRDWAAEIATSFPSEVAELALAHKVGSAVENAYRRSNLFDQRRKMAEAWATWCDGNTAEVVPMRAVGAP